MLKVVGDAQIALCLDPSAVNLASPDKTQIDPTDLFGFTTQTYAELVDRINKCKLKLSKPVILNKPVRFSNSPSLAHVERNIFASKPPKIPASGKIRIVCAPNSRAEVQFVAQQITKLVRHAGCRYRDIAVIASDIDSYENYINACFKDYDIPVFIDKRKPLNQHPVIEFVCSALSAVINNFPNTDIFAYLKTDLLDIQRSDVDLLENYCIAFGITASDWTSDKPWRYAVEKAERFDENRVNQIRKKAISPLRELDKQLKGDALLTAERFAKIIFDFLEEAGVRKRLSGWVEQALQKSDYAAADEHRQLYDRLIDVLDELVEAFAGSSLDCPDYLAILRCAFSQITLAFIPPTLDQVLVGSIERSRHPDLKAVFLIGTTERQFPAPVAFDSILSEEDRLAAQSAGLDLPPGVRQELANRPYLAYIAFTRPSEFLCITCPAVDHKSNAVARSPFVDNLVQLFEDLEDESIASSPQRIEDICTPNELEDILCSRLGKQPPLQADGWDADGLLQDILKDDQFAKLGSRVVQAIGYKNEAILDNSVVGQLFDEPLSSSASRLSTFAECPYRHFARYVLKLEKREEFKLEPLDLGDFYHSALDGFLKRTVAGKVNFETVTSDALIKILNEETDKLCRDDSFISKFAAHSPHNAFMIRSATEYLRDCVVAISQMIRAGNFRPALSEVAFGHAKSTGDTIGELAVSLSDGRRLLLNGRIDRLDVATIDGKKVALVFDYKKHSKDSFSWSEFFHGLDIQLAIYMLAVRNATQHIAGDIAGAFYLPVEVGPENVAISRAADNNPKFTHKARGIFNGQYASSLDSAAAKDSRFYNFFVTKEGDPYGKYNFLGILRPAHFGAFLAFCAQKIAKLAEQILSGEITAKPYRLGTNSPCGQCEYKPVCRFDWQINDYNLLASVNKEQVLARITNTDEPKEH